MRSIHKLTACLLLASMAMGLFSCEKKGDEPIQSGITVSPDETISESSVEHAETVVFELVKYYASKKSAAELPSALLEKIDRISKDVCSMISDIPLSEERFTDLIGVLENMGKSVIDEMLEPSSDKEKLRTFYLDICSLVGYDYVGTVLYRALAYSLEYRYEECMERYEKYGFSYLLDDANAVLADKELLTAEVGEGKFIQFFRSATAISALWLGNGFDGESGIPFTDEEILTFVSKIDLSLELSDNGWEVLLRHTGSLLSVGGGSEILACAAKNGDIEKIASVMTSVSRLLCSVQESLSVEAVRDLREGGREAFVGRIFELFGEREWLLFAEITSQDVNSDEYVKIFENRFGEDFVNYKDNLRIVSLDELKESLGQDNFYESLEGYVGGISPAFSYGMRK